MKAVLIGDSHSQIVFPRLKQQLGFEVLVEESRPGWGVKRFLSSGLVGQLPQSDVVFVALGGNNQNLTDSYRQEVKSFLNAIQKSSQKVIWIGPYYSTESSVQRRHKWTNELLLTMLSGSTLYIPMMSLSKNFIPRDGVHYSAQDYSRMVEMISRKVKFFSLLPLPVLLLRSPLSMVIGAAASVYIASR